MADLLAAEGLDVPALFSEAGLDHRLLERADGRFAVEQVDRLWALAEQRSAKPFIARSRTQADKPTSFDVLAYAMMSCGNLGEAVQRLVQYRGVVSEAVAFYRWVTCRELRPLGVELPYPTPADLSWHITAFGCTPRFDAPHHALLLQHDDLQLPLPTANEALSRLHDRVVREHLQGLHPERIESRVAASVVRRLASGRVTRKDVAAELCMSDRSLQRRLAEAGTTFQNEMDRLRRQMTENYLNDPRLPLASITPLLGFAEESSFFRACQRWFDMSPRQFRAREAAS